MTAQHLSFHPHPTLGLGSPLCEGQMYHPRQSARNAPIPLIETPTPATWKRTLQPTLSSAEMGGERSVRFLAHHSKPGHFADGVVCLCRQFWQIGPPKRRGWLRATTRCHAGRQQADPSQVWCRSRWAVVMPFQRGPGQHADL